MEKFVTVGSRSRWFWTLPIIAALPLFMALNIEGIYISILFGLRVYAVFNLRPAWYPSAALFELALVALNPFNRLFPLSGSFNADLLTVHAASIAVTYACAWVLRAEIGRVVSQPEKSPYLLILVLVALAAAGAAVPILLDQLISIRDFSYTVSAAFARLNVYVTSALVFGIYAIIAIGRSPLGARHISASLGMMLLTASMLALMYRLYELSGNLSVIFLFLIVLMLLAVSVSFRFGSLMAVGISFSCIVLFSSTHEGWSLSTWHLSTVYLLLLVGTCISAAIYGERLRISEYRLIDSAQRERSLIRNLQELELSLESRNAEHTNGIIHSLHDDVGQGLVAANLYIQVLQSRARDPAILEAANKASEMLEYTEKRIRAVLNRLADEHIDFGAIRIELESGRIATLLKSSGIDYRLLLSSNREVWQDLDARYWRFIYRFFQESVTNLLRHSRASNCRIQLLSRDGISGGCVVVSIRDNDTENYYDFQRADSLGLRNLVSSGVSLGGRFWHCRTPAFKKMAFHLPIPPRCAAL